MTEAEVAQKAQQEMAQRSAWAAEIARQVELNAVLLVRSACNGLIPNYAAQLHAVFDLQAKAVAVLPDAIAIEASISAKGYAGEQRDVPAYDCLAVFRLHYSLAQPLSLPADAYKAFAEFNGMVNAYPYMREFMQSSMQRMGYQPLLLPVFRIGRPLQRAAVPALPARKQGPQATAVVAKN